MIYQNTVQRFQRHKEVLDVRLPYCNEGYNFSSLKRYENFNMFLQLSGKSYASSLEEP